MSTLSYQSMLPPGMAAGIPVHASQQRARDRLHEAAACLPACSRITVMAGDVNDVLNALWQETQRADRAEARLESLAAANSGTAAPSAN